KLSPRPKQGKFQHTSEPEDSLQFPDLEEGGLATYRAAIVQNQHLAVLAKKLYLEKFMLYAHESDLCHELELRHALPDIPICKVIECNGPTSTRVYMMADYFRGKRLACSNGHSTQQAEMNAAKQALENSKDLFPQLDRQKRTIAQSLKRQKVRTDDRSATSDAILWTRGRTRTGSDAARWISIRRD
ncbi:ribonuclease 3-like, partial [Culex pipiens pallens]|uniref:ribonuclease 3-like n=1 Tax=Culex pipiens pallens TaxID=42434 RepID=UPI0022AAD034